MITPQPAMGSALDAPTLAVEPGVGGWQRGDLCAMT